MGMTNAMTQKAKKTLIDENCFIGLDDGEKIEAWHPTVLQCVLRLHSAFYFIFKPTTIQFSLLPFDDRDRKSLSDVRVTKICSRTLLSRNFSLVDFKWADAIYDHVWQCDVSSKGRRS